MKDKARILNRGGVRLGAVFLLAVVITVASAAFRFRSGEIDYLNSDASWHVLLTVEAYNETPVSQHLFLPIISLGQDTDKWIPWGATVPDTQGNYYYTSFSPAGFVLAWLFIKLLHLPVSESSLYLLNTLLMAISVCLWMWLLAIVYRNSHYREALCFIGGILYITTPELLHGMGIVYWHQSILQVTLLCQIIAYYRYAVLGKKKSKYVFYLFTLINPYIEWTGYVANAGFAIAEIICNRRKGIKGALMPAVKIGLLTVGSFALFSAHYLMRIDPGVFLAALRDRFMARGVTTRVAFADVISGYFKSFLYVWIVLLILLVWCFVKNGKLEISNGLLLLVMAFPVVENLIMKQHALAYTYDRMKAAFVLVFIVCEVARNILETGGGSAAVLPSAMMLIMMLSTANLISYKNDASYIWNVGYKENNKKLAEFAVENYQDALYASDYVIRGYMNLLFGRGIYEWKTEDAACALARQLQRDEVVYIIQAGGEIRELSVHNLAENTLSRFRIEDGSVTQCYSEDGYRLANLTDANWTGGCSNTSNTVLFNRDDGLLFELLTHDRLAVGDRTFGILNVDYDSLWIRVLLDDDCNPCMYPQVIVIE